jgi:hypothetical protein
MKSGENDRLNELLADRATTGLSAEQEQEMQHLLGQQTDIRESDYDIAAAAVLLTNPMNVEQLPAKLRSKILADAENFFAASPVRTVAQSTRTFSSDGQVQAQVIPFPARRQRLQMAGWWAAAACLALAVLAWWRQPQIMLPPGTGVATLPSIEEQYARLTSAPDVLKKQWTPTNYPGMKTVRGEVIWSDSAQRGFMRFEGLPKLDPAVAVYQLWIFDALRDDRYPVDGGVFLNERDGVLIVPINAKLKVNRPTLFAVTMESPGGVVVSKRDRLLLTAKPG